LRLISILQLRFLAGQKFMPKLLHFDFILQAIRIKMPKDAPQPFLLGQQVWSRESIFFIRLT
jgi:hypothetical protein